VYWNPSGDLILWIIIWIIEPSPLGTDSNSGCSCACNIPLILELMLVIANTIIISSKEVLPLLQRGRRKCCLMDEQGVANSILMVASPALCPVFFQNSHYFRAWWYEAVYLSCCLSWFVHRQHSLMLMQYYDIMKRTTAQWGFSPFFHWALPSPLSVFHRLIRSYYYHHHPPHYLHLHFKTLELIQWEDIQ